MMRSILMVAWLTPLAQRVVGQRDACDEALADVKSAIRSHIETFRWEVLELDPPILGAFIAEASVGS